MILFVYLIYLFFISKDKNIFLYNLFAKLKNGLLFTGSIFVLSLKDEKYSRFWLHVERILRMFQYFNSNWIWNAENSQIF